MMPNISYAAVAPEMALLLTGIAVMLYSAMAPESSKKLSAFLTFLGVAVAFSLVLGVKVVPGSYYVNMLTVDSYGFFFRVLFILIAGAAVLAAAGYLSLQGIEHGEYYALLMFCVVGMMSMVTSNELLVIFIGVEVLSVGLYVMAGFQRENEFSIEASVKYFLLGAFSTSFFLFGIALIYGATKSTSLPVIAQRIAGNEMANPELVLPGLALLLVGFLFKVSAFPFHMWTPDVYQGAPTPVTVFMAVGPKIAGFAAMTRVLFTAFPTLDADWSRIAVVVSACTMVIGNVTALRQTNIKRMLAYSSIAHVGYVMMAFACGRNTEGVSGMMFYLVSYAAMNFAAFGAILALGSKDRELLDIERYGGVGFRYPFIGAVLTISLLSLAGIPPTAGFFGKFFIFKAALDANHPYLVIFAVLNSALSLYYYLRPVIYCYMKPEGEEAPASPVFLSLLVVMTFSTGVILHLGIRPATLLDIVEKTFLPLYRLSVL